jgi:hypothetical protein
MGIWDYGIMGLWDYFAIIHGPDRKKRICNFTKLPLRGGNSQIPEPTNPKQL